MAERGRKIIEIKPGLEEQRGRLYEKDPEKISKLIKLELLKPEPKVTEKFKTNWAKEIVNRIIKLKSS